MMALQLVLSDCASLLSEKAVHLTYNNATTSKVSLVMKCLYSYKVTCSKSDYEVTVTNFVRILSPLSWSHAAVNTTTHQSMSLTSPTTASPVDPAPAGVDHSAL